MVRATKSRIDADGVRVVETRAIGTVLWVFALATAVVALTVVLAVLAIRRAPAREEPLPAVVSPVERLAPTPPVHASVESPAAPVEHARPVRARRRDTQPAVPDQLPSVDAKKLIETLTASGERTGIAVFGVPGTKPVKRGLVVPDDFPLPEGYVRHHQTTDDGRPLPAILMFHPDYEFVNERGERVPLPEDRVVPPEMAPAGLPIQILEVPEKTQGAPGVP